MAIVDGRVRCVDLVVEVARRRLGRRLSTLAILATLAGQAPPSREEPLQLIAAAELHLQQGAVEEAVMLLWEADALVRAAAPGLTRDAADGALRTWPVVVMWLRRLLPTA